MSGLPPDPIADRLVSLDFETHLITPTCLAPKPVCLAVATRRGAVLLRREEALDAFQSALEDPEIVLVGANISYDLGVFATARPEALRLVFRALADGRVFDVQLGVALDAIARGRMGKDAHGQPLRNEKGKPTDRYSLWLCVKEVLGREDAKANDEWKLRYAELEDIETDLWPEPARQYPLDDARNTLEVAMRLLACGPFSALEPYRNLEDLPDQVRAAFAEHLASMEGLWVDQAAVDEYLADAEEKRKKGLEIARKAGLIRSDAPRRRILEVERAGVRRFRAALECGHVAIVAARRADTECIECPPVISETDSKNTTAIKRRLLHISGAREPCSHRWIETAEDGQVTAFEAKQEKCKLCDKTGLQIPATVQRTEAGAISIAREVLEDSGDDDLAALADAGKYEKALTTYGKYLRSACPTIHPRPNPLLVTGRSSYDGVIQQFPRKGKARSCIVAGPGRLLVGGDYAQLELVCWAQVCLWLLGRSDMAEAILAGVDVHSDLASVMLGRSYADVKALVDRAKAKRAAGADLTAEELVAELYRQNSKGGNFGFPGGMGPLKFVRYQRHQGVVLCRALGRKRCEPIPAFDGGTVCSECLAIATDVRQAWRSRWTEAPLYFDRISGIVDTTGEVPTLVPDSVREGGVARWRGAVTFSEACNNFFQSLAAAGAKDALWALTEACWLGGVEELIGTVPVLFMHDEIRCSSPEDKAAGAEPLVAAIMVERMRRHLPDLAPGVKVETKVSRRWEK